jgi:beta-lactamase regulating signal transducer with metallopeptidase domain
MISPSVLGWALETFVATTLLMLLVLAIRAPVRKALGPGVAYALWLLPVLRMALPPLPESWREQAAAPVAAMGDVITYYVVDGGVDAPAAAATAAAAPSSVDWLLVAAIAWGLGALAFLGFHLVSHSRFCSRLLSRARVDRTVANGRVRVIETDAAHGPLAFGVWRKYVAFPRDFSERYDEVERDLALAHELGHHVRGDLIANWVALVVLALHWFNPIAWKAFRAFRADQEMACDALVLAGREAALRHAYGRAIVKSAHGGAVSAACHLHTINELKGRLRMLTKTRKLSRARFAAGLVGVSALSLAALGLTASGSQAAERLKSNVEAATGLSLQDAPPPPAAPAAAPEVQAVPEPAPAPHVERHVYRVEDGKPGKHERHVVVVRNGERFEMPDMPDVAEIEAMVPDIQSRKCKDSGDGPGMVVHDGKGEHGKQRIIICVDRVEAMAARGAEMGERYRHLGMRSALMGLRMARRSIEAEKDMTDAERSEALKGIDDAIRQVEKQTDGKDDDAS